MDSNHRANIFFSTTIHITVERNRTSETNHSLRHDLNGLHTNLFSIKYYEKKVNCNIAPGGLEFNTATPLVFDHVHGLIS